MAAGRFADPRFGIVLCVTLASCLLDNESSPKPEHRALEFDMLVVPSHVAAGDSAVVDVFFIMGGDSCWRLESLTTTAEGNVISIEGTSVRPDPRAKCPTISSWGTRSLGLPALSAGTFVVKAGALADTIVVGSGASSPRDRLVMTSELLPTPQGCRVVFVDPITGVALSGLPTDFPVGTYVVRGEVTEEDPCGLQALFPSPLRYFVSVRELTHQPSP